MIEPGRLYIVATPIGNLKDISLRALEVLRSVTVIGAEDTRLSRRLLSHYQINTPLFSLHEHNEKTRITSIIEKLKRGNSIALISDAGTPLISDPGFLLVRECHRENILVSPIPGACAAIAALSVSGLPTDQFYFAGFLPAKTKARCDRIQLLATQPATVVFYESSHRISACLTDLISCLGESRKAVIARELTKTFETIYQGKLIELQQTIMSDLQQQKGEFVILIAGVEKTKDDMSECQRVLNLLLKELSLSQAVKLAVQLTGIRRKIVYDLALKLHAGDGDVY